MLHSVRIQSHHSPNQLPKAPPSLRPWRRLFFFQVWPATAFWLLCTALLCDSVECLFRRARLLSHPRGAKRVTVQQGSSPFPPARSTITSRSPRPPRTVSLSHIKARLIHRIIFRCSTPTPRPT
ncbi:hypothetical protein CORC01_09255 [Colletotrichum orchidophilum]|uniref:Uncharacterized protein n=1 Tax=Colletotrichum orchidophilum TaxID=1209926 RepID=A0A1G4B209_9PEZI|nr:uncharacterized protein CORC01_09255 [Colletotrichum orchidophilum]OHE95383.1 hypothetical protein CORC01_09255 [Colletotrichum orchidophilum]